MNQIKNARSFVVESYYATYRDDTNVITTSFDVDQEYLDSVNRITITQKYIPNTIWQYDPTDYFILQEGITKKQINMPYANFKSFTEMATFFQKLLNDNSPNNFSYTVVFNSAIYQDTLTITCSDSILAKSITAPRNHLAIGFGINQSGDFINNNTLTTTFLELTPIKVIYINSTFVNSYNTVGLQSTSILGIYDLQNPNQYTDPFLSAKVFNHTKRGSFALSDYDGDLVSLNGHHWYLEVTLFYFDEALSDKFKIYLDMVTIKMLEERQLKKLLEKEEDEKRKDYEMDMV